MLSINFPFLIIFQWCFRTKDASLFLAVIFNIIGLYVASIVFCYFLNSIFLVTYFFVSKGHLPFAIVGSLEEVKIGNKTVKARQYPWGIVQGKREFESPHPHLDSKGCQQINQILVNHFLIY